ncbi:hypothetical protein BMS3Bbin01_01835 [bacterium BMS3Bbin01]|nr:hypothetical protein BMS3Bbin01_01835 [bacterium BMS3Bbin01]
MVLVGALVVDVTLQVAEVLLYGAGQLDGAGNFLALWDLAKAALTTAALLFAAHRFRSKIFASFAIVYFAVAAEDQLDLHQRIAGRVTSLVRSVLSAGGWIPAHSEALGQLLFLTAFAAAGFVFIWVWRPAAGSTEHRARLVLTALLVTLYVFAGVVDFVGSVVPDRRWPIIEESGERLTMTLSMAYAAGLAFVSLRKRAPGEGSSESFL